LKALPEMMAAPAPTKRKMPAPKWINAPKLAFQAVVVVVVLVVVVGIEGGERREGRVGDEG